MSLPIETSSANYLSIQTEMSFKVISKEKEDISINIKLKTQMVHNSKNVCLKYTIF